uniref:Carbon disulfide hydrolase n=1 Tax=Acidianus sp. (strain A1-3) TaxID=1071056 RepID=CS2H_ACIS1|nr:RecName: Full=Carbon disulfide hydrolase; Short=CS(2) hydrolase; AltName: Full=Carbon disulfide lyase [Acidianus sp. A1-3]3TEN_A Chain A, CS2 hydrolase [Acidianus sp. A1-3]3TEN_B Chain B, CS2 hydrolase [Acidianus sp. A1-3]3TEN_C Chain C, CS2 hydrolase [Acidianus sp. A1-3]3TEN_D Chain D, CS2 hydrolase [Acidianus sp. A1-3]3TEN_E Chain E, CS2 hydrolase [Acidianus sp. A1-3]3TEN_F Chain F, CS2 hydrolase [Acidianus sp. A1-3]3TEN_G Chain G, CS2 hydrolase [Acidianus sp. A1-3]3TEN_H Chain H, CS2 
MVSEYIDSELKRLEDYALRRVKGIPNNRRLWVLTCMDERVHIEQSLGIQPDDAHIYRNAGGIVTDDAIRSASLTTNFFGTKEIIVVTHTDCGMLRFTGEEVAKYFISKGIKPTEVQLDPLLPAFRISSEEDFIKWFKFYEDLGVKSPDEMALKGVEILRNHPLIPKDVRITGYVYEVETHRLRKPNQIIYNETSKFEHGTIVKE